MKSNEEKQEEYSKSNFVEKYSAALAEYKEDVNSYIESNYQTLYKKYINSADTEVTEEDKKKKFVLSCLLPLKEGKRKNIFLSKKILMQRLLLL